VSAEVNSSPSGAKVKNERNHTIMSPYNFKAHTRKNLTFLYNNAKVWTSQPSNLGDVKNFFSVIYQEQNHQELPY
jgi:hypothetical protein